MATKKAFRLAVTLEAGTTDFFAKMKAAGVELKEFEKKAEGLGSGVSGIRATSGALRLLQGDVQNNLRAVESFVSVTLGLGPLLKAAFPLVGAIAFGGTLVELSQKAYDFYRTIAEAPEKIRGGFHGLNDSIRLTNEELSVAGDKLELSIQKLEGGHQNTLKLALDEAALSADRLAESLERDLSQLNKLLSQNKPGFIESLGQTGVNASDILTLLTGGLGGAVAVGAKAGINVSTQDIGHYFGGETGEFGGAAGRLSRIHTEGDEKIDAIRSSTMAPKAKLEAEKKAIKEMNEALLGEYQKGLDYLAAAMKSADTKAQQERIEGAQGVLRGAVTNAHEAIRNAQLAEKNAALEAAAANAKQDRPYNNAVKGLDAQIAGLDDKLAAIGKGEQFKALAEAASEARKQIVTINEALAKQHELPLDATQEANIKALHSTEALKKESLQWGEAMDQERVKIAARIASLDMLTDALGKGYAAQRAVNIETQVAAQMKDRYNDPYFAKDQAVITSRVSDEVDAAHRNQTATAVQGLNEQIALEKALLAVQKDGAEALRQAAFAVRLERMRLAGATQEEIEAEIKLYNLQRANATATDIDKIERQVEATNRLTQAITRGASAVRQANLENKIAAAEGEDGAHPGMILGPRAVAAVQEDASEHAKQVAQAAANANPLQDIDEKIKLLQEAYAQAKADRQSTLAIEIQMRDMENQRLQALAKETIALGGLKDGWHAFLISMQTDAKKASEMIYEALNSALDRTSDNLAKMLTGQKASWAREFKEIGEQLAKSSIKSELQHEIGQLGKIWAPAGKIANSLGLNKKDGSTEELAFWVKLANSSAAPGTYLDQIQGKGGGAAPSSAGSRGIGGGTVFGGSQGGGIFNFSGDFGAIPYGGPMADGGGVQAGTAYKINERNTEYFIPGRSGTVIPHPGSMGGSTVIYQVDARGSALGVENRINQGLAATHDMSVAHSVQAQNQRNIRTPRRS